MGMIYEAWELAVSYTLLTHLGLKDKQQMSKEWYTWIQFQSCFEQIWWTSINKYGELGYDAVNLYPIVQILND